MALTTLGTNSECVEATDEQINIPYNLNEFIAIIEKSKIGILNIIKANIEKEQN